MKRCATMMHRLLSYGPQKVVYVRRRLREYGFVRSVIDAAAAELKVAVVGKGLTGIGEGFWKLPQTPLDYRDRPRQLHAAPPPPPRRRQRHGLLCAHCGRPTKGA